MSGSITIVAVIVIVRVLYYFRMKNLQKKPGCESEAETETSVTSRTTKLFQEWLDDETYESTASHNYGKCLSEFRSEVKLMDLPKLRKMSSDTDSPTMGPVADSASPTMGPVATTRYLSG